MKYTIIGDPHLTHDSMDKVQQIMDKVEKLGHSTIWLGDLLDTKEVIRGKCLSAWIDYFSNSPLKHYVLVGNHDLFNLESDRHSLEALNLLKNVVVVEKPTRLVEAMYAIPYMHHEDDIKAAIKDIPEGSILFGHLELKDFDFGNGRICEKGMTEKSFSKFRRVISGHFHKYQEKGNLTYLGTPFSHTFGEANQDKFIAVYDSDEEILELIPSGMPKHISVEYNCDKMLDDKSHMFIDLSDPLFNLHSYRVILTGKQENIDKFPRDMYLKGGSKGKLKIKFISKPTKEVVDEVVIDESISNSKQFETWAKDIAKLPKDVITLGQEILESVK